jgi:hypothetical protein
MNTQSSHFKQEAELIRVKPPRSAWKRVEARLDADGSRREIKTARLINYAAAIILLAVFAAIGLYFYSTPVEYEASLYTFKLEEISADPTAGVSIYDVEKVRELSAYFAAQ